jgi:4-amino-4-deoxy-L-arabinose transferase-like glycosyltransferase
MRVLLAGQDVFADELSTLWIVQTNDLSGVVSTVHTNAEITPPLSFILAWAGSKLGSAPEWMRAASVVAGAVTIPAVYAFGARTVGRRAGLLAAVFTTLAPFMLYYSSEARGYAVMMALALLSTVSMLAAVDTRRRIWWVAYAVFSVASMYTHYTAVFVLAVQAAWVLWVHPEARVPALVANGAAAIAYLPWLSGLRADFDSPTTEILSKLQPFDADHVRVSLEHWSVGYPYRLVVPLTKIPGTPAVILLGLATLVAVTGIAIARRRDGAWTPWTDLPEPRSRAVLVVALALATPVGAALFSAFGGTTLFSTRNLAASWPALAVAFAALMLAAGPRLRVVAVTLTLVPFAIGAVKTMEPRYARPGYQKAADFIDRSAGSRDVVIDETAYLSPGPYSHVDPYIDSRFRDSGRIIRARAPAENDHPFTVLDPIPTADQATRQARAKAHGARIFLVSDSLGAAVKRPLGPYRLVEKHAYTGVIEIDVLVYARPS